MLSNSIRLLARVVEMGCIRCIVDKLWGNETAYKKRFGKDFDGPFITYGAQIRYLPDKDDQRAHKFGDKMFPGIFILKNQEVTGTEIFY